MFNEKYRDQVVDSYLGKQKSHSHGKKWYTVPMAWYILVIVVIVPVAGVIAMIWGAL